MKTNIIKGDTNNTLPLALVTGAGHRLGRAIACRLANLGYHTVIHYHTARQEAEETQKQINGQGGKATIIQSDLTQPEQIDTLFEKIRSIEQPLEVLVNSSATMLRGRLNDFSLEQWDLIMNLNLRAVWLCSQKAAKLMQARGGVIINISDSGAGRMWANYGAYSISKAGVEVLTRLLAKTLAPNIRVNAVAPGLILPPDDFADDVWEELVQRLPLKRSGNPEDIGNAIEFILNNDYFTGQILTMDGGYQLI